MKNNIMTIVKSLFNQSYRESIKNLQNQVKVILDVTPNISDKFEYVDFKLIKQIQSDFKNLEKIMKEMNFNKKVEESRTLKILTKVHTIRELDYDRYIIHSTPINWKMWDKFLNIVKDVYSEIEWEKYSELDLLLCVFLWCSYQGPNYYNEFLKKEDEKALPNVRSGDFGSIEFFITIDGYIKNNLQIPINLLKTISHNTYYGSLGESSIKALKHIQDKRIRLIRNRYSFYMNEDIYGLKVEDYKQFRQINYSNKKEKDWIQWGEHDGYVLKYK